MMIRKYVLPLLALAGVAIAIAAVIFGNRSPRLSASRVNVPAPPYPFYIAGAGVIEASTGNIAVGTPVPGIVLAIYVKWGDNVNAGDPLFKIDDRDLEAQLPTAAAKTKESEAELAKEKYLLDIGQNLRGKSGVISEEDFRRRRFEVETDDAAVAARQAEVEQIKKEIERRTVRAPVAGRILQMNLRLGEFAPSGTLSAPLMILGDDIKLNVRIDVDEYDAWRFRPESQAKAFVRGNPVLNMSLRFERIEPFIIPKTSLTGASTERTDTRVLQVIYSFARDDVPVYAGQQVDVFIQAEPADQTRPSSKLR